MIVYIFTVCACLLGARTHADIDIYQFVACTPHYHNLYSIFNCWHSAFVECNKNIAWYLFPRFIPQSFTGNKEMEKLRICECKCFAHFTFQWWKVKIGPSNAPSEMFPCENPKRLFIIGCVKIEFAIELNYHHHTIDDDVREYHNSKLN